MTKSGSLFNIIMLEYLSLPPRALYPIKQQILSVFLQNIK